jgi:DNA-binding NarL/FixJ family response regulator
MTAIVRHAIVLLFTDDQDRGTETAAALAAMGCIAHRLEPDARLCDVQRHDAAVLIARRTSNWCPVLLGKLRSIEFACATLVLLDVGGPEAVEEVLRRGAVDCLVGPVTDPELLESIRGVIEATRRWRARFARARLLEASLEDRGISKRSSAAARVFEPVEQPTPSVTTSIELDDDAKVEAVVERLGEQSGLTARERQVLFWLLLGHRYVDIATVLGVAPRTAKFHAANLLTKLDLDSRYDLSRLLAQELQRNEL